MSNRKITTYPDGSMKIIVEDTRTPQEKLETLTFADKLDLMYPTKTTEAEITQGWVEFDDHKRLK